MSLWSDFTDTISTRAKSAANAFMSILPNYAAGTASAQMAPTLPDPAQSDQVIRKGIQDALLKNKMYDINVKSQSNDLVLKAAVKLNDNVISPLITRPISTISLLGDTNSELYQPGEYEKGFQVSDIRDAYNRSKSVSIMQAITKSDLSPLAKGVSKVVLETGGIDANKVDLWDDQSIHKNFSENAVGKWYTGVGDFFAGNIAFGVAGKMVGAGAKWATKTAGLNTTGKTVSEFENEINSGFVWADTAGTQGTQSVAAAHMQELANTKDFTVISEIVDKYSTNADLIPILHQTTSREVARDLILADKGNINAMERLATTAPSELFELGDVPGQIKAQTLLTGKAYVPEGPAVERLQLAYEDAIAKNPKMDELRKIFLDDNYNPKVGGRVSYFPAEPIVGKGLFIKAGEARRSLKSQAANGNFEDFGTFASLKLGDRIGGAVTHVVKISARGAGYKPLGFVTFSGMRPMDGHTELRAFLGNMDIFKDGSRMIETSPGKFEKASDVVKSYESQFLNAGSEIDKVKALEAIDENIGLLVAYSNNYYEAAVIKAQIANIRAEMTRGAQAFQKNGYAINHDGSRIVTNAQTLRQLAESYRFTPWDIIEREFAQHFKGAAKASKIEAAKITKSFYEDLSRFWTFDVLARPSFIVKQSIVEPLISTSIAVGIGFSKDAVKNLAGRGATNLRNKVMGSASRIYNRKELKEINQMVSDKQQSLSRAIAIKDMLQAEHEALLSAKSPALREQHLPQVTKELRAADKLVDDLEMDLHNATVPFGVKAVIPSVTLLERRLAWIEKNATTEEGAKLASKIANAKAAIGQYKGSINSLAINRQALQDVEDKLAQAYDDIDGFVQDLSIVRRTQADTFGKSAKYKQAYLGETSQYRMVDGQWVDIASFVNDPSGNNFVRAIRAEVANSRTTEMNYIGELSVGTRKSMIQRKVPNVPITITNPIYYEELANIANNFVRQEVLMDQILAGKSKTELYKWGLTKEGRSYLDNFGVIDENQIPAYIDDKIGLVHRTFPSDVARRTILEREVSAQDMQKMLAPYEERLFEISPGDWNYAEHTVFGNNWYTGFNNAVGTATSKIFKMLTSPENPIREAYFDRVAIDKVAEKAAYLMKQGVPMTPKRWNALRQSAGREALQDLEKTIYTTRRQNRLLYAARAGVAFPTATLNAFYRYGRLAIKNPQRVGGFLYNYGRTFETFGVDKNGNPTKNPNEMAYLIVPGSKELGLGQYDEGIALNARSLGFMLNMATPSYISALAVGTVMKLHDNSEGAIKKALGPLWDIWFPYGAPTSLTKSLTPPWANAAYNAITGDKGRADYLNSYTSVYDYHKMMIELGHEKTMPSQGQLEIETRKLWEQKARWAFISPFGVPIQVQTNKMDLVDSLWYTLMNKYEKQGLSYEDAKTSAGKEMLSTMGPNFLVDRVAFNGKTSKVNIPETPEAWDRIFKNNIDLVTKLSDIKKGDIRLVGLLTGDLKVAYEDRNLTVARRLADPNTTLPNSSKLINSMKMTPEEIEVIRQKNRVWEDYVNLKAALQSKLPAGKTLRSAPNLQAALDHVVQTEFKQRSRAWYDEYNNAANGDSAYSYATAFNMIAKDKQFMNDNISSKYFQDIVAFNAFRNKAVRIYNMYGDRDARKAIFKDAYLTRLSLNAQGWHPEVRRIIETNFDNDNMKVVE